MNDLRIYRPMLTDLFLDIMALILEQPPAAAIASGIKQLPSEHCMAFPES